MSYDYGLNLIIVGDTGVGKSCLLLNFIDKSFKKEHMVTVGIDFGSKMLTCGKNTYKLLVWDTAGQEMFNSVARTYYKSAVGVLLVYDITCRRSFESIMKWVTEIKEYANQNISILVVANKTDMEEKRVVSTQEGEKLAKDQGFEYIEASAKDSFNVEEAFVKLTSAVHENILKGSIELKRNMNMKIQTNSRVKPPTEDGSRCAC